MEQNGAELIVGLDIGTTKVCAVVAEVSQDRQLKIIGIGDSESKGLRKGMVVNIEDTVRSIRQAVDAAGQMAGCNIASVFVGIAGGHIMGINSHGVIAVQSKEVTASDVARVLEAARTVAIPSDREVIHTLPQEFIVDSQRGIVDPIGMAGVRLEVNVHIVTAAVSGAQNIINCCNRAGLHVEDIVLESLASAKAVLTDEEREIGVALVDLGGGTSDIAIYENNAIKHTAVVPLGGSTLTNDIAFGLRTPTKSAERIKIKYGCSLRDLVQMDETIEVPSVGGRPPQKLSRLSLTDICEPRMEEIFTFVDRTLVNTGCKDRIRAGVVLTGGAALIEGGVELGEQVFNVPVRLGYPTNVKGLTDVVNNPKFATAVGLLHYGAEKKLAQQALNEGAQSSQAAPAEVEDHEPIDNAQDPDGLFSRLMRRMRRWFQDIA
ncbi:MAG: cell division protein FtsA [Desulfovibrionaceae bacterium]|nr:cell division protein FtsA [Desulfovibrionaceae bacterium]